MPNQRSEFKHVFGVSLDKQLLAKIDKLCASEGITRTEFFRRLAENKVSNNNNKEDC